MLAAFANYISCEVSMCDVLYYNKSRDVEIFSNNRAHHEVEIQYVERVVRVPQIQYVDEIIEVPEVQSAIKP